MLTLQSKYNQNPLLISTQNQSIDNLLNRQWLLTNGYGGYASSSISGCNTSSYHGLLIGALNPPVKRVMALSNCIDTVVCDGKSFNLTPCEFPDKFETEGIAYLRQFRKDFGVHFSYEIYDSGVKLEKSIYLLRDADTVTIVYDFIEVNSPIEFYSRPLAGLRDFHSIQKSSEPLYSTPIENGVSVRRYDPDGCELILTSPNAQFIEDQQWWFNFMYRDNQERGLNHMEDLWTPGFFKSWIDAPSQIVLWASLLPCDNNSQSHHPVHHDIQAEIEDLQSYHKNLISTIEKTGSDIPLLDNGKVTIPHSFIDETFSIAADQFIAKRNKDDIPRTTIIAGYPWFMDWGRDAFISMPGLLLSTGRFDEAKSVLTTFASALYKGMVPSRFDDENNTACFNSVDASLWFINAAFQYFHATNDSKTFIKRLLPSIEEIINAYENGTRFNIHADIDGLITAGSPNTQLTWMDAKYDGITFTPRYGKAVEINALWHNNLCLLANFYSELAQKSKTSLKETKKSKFYQEMADDIKTSFCNHFWNEQKNYLNDCITTEGLIDDNLRPNQIYAVSLDYSPLSAEQQKAVVKAVQDSLLTPYGLRSLNTSAQNYKGKYTGPQRYRDEAYHQGTVWAFLIGPFIDGYLKVNEFSYESRRNAEEMIQPLLKHLIEDSCIGSVSEIFDGDSPHYPKGCFAQAWSVAELYRAYKLVTG
ncbi:MAG: glycogen debranching enzyme family protein [Sedimentisphaerales bacterium]|nr:glycogen debranching enzyme family protein [Sedimentisphaerales bacterium]